jgi:hypothetical protein
MFTEIINKIKSLENTTLIIGGIGILLLIILLAYMTKRSKKQPSVVEGEPQGQDCFGGVCQVPPHIKETLTQEDQVPMPIEPVVGTEPIHPVQQPVQQLIQQQNIEEEQPIEEQSIEQQSVEQQSVEQQSVEQQSVEQQSVEVQPEVLQQSINTEVLEEPMN